MALALALLAALVIAAPLVRADGGDDKEDSLAQYKAMAAVYAAKAQVWGWSKGVREGGRKGGRQRSLRRRRLCCARCVVFCGDGGGAATEAVAAAAARSSSTPLHAQLC